MSKRTLLAGLVALALGGLVLVLWPKPHVTDADRVRHLIEACVSGAEHRDIGPIVEALAPNFRGPSGMGRDEVRGLLLGYVVRSQGGRLTVLNPRLDVTETAPGIVEFSGDFIFNRPEDGTTRYELSGTLHGEGGTFKFVEVRWRQP